MTESKHSRDSLATVAIVNPNVRYDARDLELDNGVSRQIWPWDFYSRHSKLQRVILYLLHGWDYWDRLNGDIWRGAVRVSAITKLVFKGERLTDSQRASLSRTIIQLEKQGLVNRERCIGDDGYTTHIGLTLRGAYQFEFERKQHTDKEWQKLLTPLGLKYDKYARSVNKNHKRVSRHTKGGK
jgi:transposase